MRIIRIYPESIVDGEGLRYAIYFAGCTIQCRGCHNPDSWEFEQGTRVTRFVFDALVAEINNNPLLDGITISGGNPIENVELFYFLRDLKEKTDKNIWLYTGYTFEDIKDNPCLQYVDTVVDGAFIEELKDLSLSFRGSSNQRILKKGIDY